MDISLFGKHQPLSLAGMGVDDALKVVFGDQISTSLDLVKETDNDVYCIANQVLTNNQNDQTLKRKYVTDTETNESVKLQRTISNVIQNSVLGDADAGQTDVQYRALDPLFYDWDGKEIESLDCLERLFAADEKNSAPASIGDQLVNTVQETSLLYVSVDQSMAITISQKLELPKMALEKVINSADGLSKDQMLRYFPENNQIKIQGNQFTFVCVNYYNFPDHYSCPDHSYTRRKNVFWIGKMIEVLRESSNLQHKGLNSLIAEMTKQNPERRIKPKNAIRRLEKIQSDLLMHEQRVLARMFDDPHSPLFQVQKNKETELFQSEIFNNNLKLKNILKNKITDHFLELKVIGFLEICPNLKLSERLEFSIEILKYLKPLYTGVNDSHLYEIIPENIFVGFLNGQVGIYFKRQRQIDEVPIQYIDVHNLKEKKTGGYFKRSNVFTVGEILKTTLEGTEYVPELLKDLIQSMTHRSPKNRPSLIDALKELQIRQIKLEKEGQ